MLPVADESSVKEVSRQCSPCRERVDVAGAVVERGLHVKGCAEDLVQIRNRNGRALSEVRTADSVRAKNDVTPDNRSG